MKKILSSVLAIAVISLVAGGATLAYFLDTETSIGNTFTAGTLDLQIDGTNENTVKFNVANMHAGNQPKRTYNLANVGSLNGYLDLEDVTVSSTENGCVDPEVEAGDETCDTPGNGQGELQNVVNIRLFIDYGNDGWISTGDDVFYNGKVKDLPSSFDLNEPLNAGNNINIVALLDWWSTPDDNLAQGDGMTLDLTFELGETTGQ